MAQIIRLYISGPVSETVAQSQMQSWAKLLSEKDIRTQFILLSNDYGRDVEHTSKIVSPNYVIFLSGNWFRKMLCIVKEIRKIIISHSNDKFLIQTRVNNIAIPLFFLKLIYKVKIIADFRGIGENEYGSERRKIKLNDLNNRISNYLFSHFSDVKFFVSNNLQSVYRKKFGLKGKNNYIIPCAADCTTFFFDPKLRSEMRSKFGLGDTDIVILYSGKLDKPWQIPETIVSTFKKLSEYHTLGRNFRFFVLTPDIGIAHNLMHRYLIDKENYQICEASGSELNSFYNLADFGVLFRKLHIVNSTAAPTKFAEYSLAGLPTLISEEVGDYSELIYKNPNFGIVLPWKGDQICLDENSIEKISTSVIYNTVNNRSSIAEFGITNFSKQTFIKRLKDIYFDLHTV